MNIKNKKAAMEMSMGTIVTIVLIVSFMIVGIYFLSELRKGGTNAINGINNAVESEIQTLFSEDSSKKVVIIPSTRQVKIKKGEDSKGFGLSIRNVDDEDKFSYVITAQETSCGMRLPEAERLIALSRQRNNILIPAGSVMQDPIFVKFDIPETTQPCQITYVIDIEKGAEPYGASTDVYLEIESE